MTDSQDTDIQANVARPPPRSRTRKILYWSSGALLLCALVGWVILTSYPNTIIHLIVEPKLKQLVVDRLGRRYSLAIGSIALSTNRDSLILTRVRIVDNGITGEGAQDSTTPNFGVATPLDRLTTDTVLISGLDYWKLIFQQGLFANTIAVHSPKIYLRPGALPKFVPNAKFLPSFLPAVSSKLIIVDNAEVYLTEGSPTVWEATKAGLPDSASSARTRSSFMRDRLTSPRGGVLVKHASLEFHDFFLDEPTFKQGAQTFFCKSATFHASDISHDDSLGTTDIHVTSVDGDLTDSSMTVHTVDVTNPIEEVHHVTVAKITFSGLDWYSALAGQGLHGRRVVVSQPQIYLENVADIRPTPLRHFSASDLIPLPTLLPDVSVASVDVEDAEIHALLPQTNRSSALTHIQMTLDSFKLDHKTEFNHISTFFAQAAQYSISSPNTVSTALGMVQMGEIRGTDKSVTVSRLLLKPSFRSVSSLSIRSIVLDGPDIWKLLMRDGLFCKSVVVYEPDVLLDRSATTPIQSLDSLLSFDPRPLVRSFEEYPLPRLMPAAEIGKVSITGGTIRGIHWLDDPKHPTAAGDALSGIGVSLTHLKLDRESWIRRRGMLYSDAASLVVGGMLQHTTGATYSYAENGIRGNLKNHTLTILGAAMRPVIPEDSFGKVFQFRTERLDMLAPRIDVVGLDYQSLLLGKGIFADTVIVNAPTMNVYGDRRSPEEPRTKADRFPHQIFQQIKMPVAVKRVVIRDGTVAFRERWPETEAAGTISLDHVNARVGLVTNMKNKRGDSIVTPIEGDMRIMDVGEIKYQMGYQLMNPTLALDVRASLGRIDASVLNDYLMRSEPFTLAGIVHSAKVELQLKDTTIRGTLTPVYDSLVVTFFRWDRFPPGFVSFFANAIFMRSHNIPELDQPLASALIDAPLDPNVSAFWAVWLPIRSGISSIIRIPEWVW